MKFYKDLTGFQKFFLIFFLVTGFLTFFQPVLMSQGSFSSIFTVIGIIGLISTVSGVFTCIYQARASLSCYFWWILNTITYAIVALHGALYGQVIQNIIFLLPLEIMGFIAWKRHIQTSTHGEIDVVRFTKKHWIFSIIGLAIAWVVYGYFLIKLPLIFKVLFGMNISADPSYIMDSFTAVMTIYAVWLTSKRYLEQWYFWFLSNLGVVLFIESMIKSGTVTVNDLSGALVWIQFGVSAIYGYYCWRKRYKARQNELKRETMAVSK
ncbi:MAG: nicotinamide riboside transporter PnuC [Sarcina sp.]